MNLILVIILVVLIAGGGYGWHGGYVGAPVGLGFPGLLVIVLIVLLLTGRL